LARAQELQQIYEDVDDVDLFVGMFSERPMNGALVGPITLCIVGDQFARLKKGDRFFYDLGGQQGAAPLTESELTEVREDEGAEGSSL
jgi:peroxidase